MIEELKVLLAERAENYTEAQMGLALKLAIGEVEEYCKRDMDYGMELAALQIAKIKLNRLDTEGLASQAFSGSSENYIDGYPQEIQNLLNRKRKIKVLQEVSAMINATMRFYDYFTLGENDDYGQPRLSTKKGSVKMSINLQTQTPADNIKYKDATYVGLTLDKAIDDSYIIQLDEKTRLKVLYVNPFGRYKQVYMAEML